MYRLKPVPPDVSTGPVPLPRQSAVPGLRHRDLRAPKQVAPLMSTNRLNGPYLAEPLLLRGWWSRCRLRSCWRSHQSRNHRRGLNVAAGCLAKIDAVMLQRRGQHLIKARAILGIAGLCLDQRVLGRGQAALLRQNKRRGRCAQLQLLSLRPPGSDCCSLWLRSRDSTCARSLVNANCWFTTCMRICV